MKTLRLQSVLLLSAFIFFSCAKDEEEPTNYLRVNGTEYAINTAIYEVEHTGASTSTHKVEIKSSADSPKNYLTFRIISTSASTLANGTYTYDKPAERKAGEFGTVTLGFDDVLLSDANVDTTYANTVEVLTNSKDGKIFDIHMQFVKNDTEYLVHARYEGEK